MKIIDYFYVLLIYFIDYSLELYGCLNKLSGSRQSEIKRNGNLCYQFLSFLDTEIIMLRNIYTSIGTEIIVW